MMNDRRRIEESKIVGSITTKSGIMVIAGTGKLVVGAIELNGSYTISKIGRTVSITLQEERRASERAALSCKGVV